MQCQPAADLCRHFNRLGRATWPPSNQGSRYARVVVPSPESCIMQRKTKPIRALGVVLLELSCWLLLGTTTTLKASDPKAGNARPSHDAVCRPRCRQKWRPRAQWPAVSVWYKSRGKRGSRQSLLVFPCAVCVLEAWMGLLSTGGHDEGRTNPQLELGEGTTPLGDHSHHTLNRTAGDHLGLLRGGKQSTNRCGRQAAYALWLQLTPLCCCWAVERGGQQRCVQARCPPAKSILSTQHI